MPFFGGRPRPRAGRFGGSGCVFFMAGFSLITAAALAMPHEDGSPVNHAAGIPRLAASMPNSRLGSEALIIFATAYAKAETALSPSAGMGTIAWVDPVAYGPPSTGANPTFSSTSEP